MRIPPTFEEQEANEYFERKKALKDQREVIAAMAMQGVLGNAEIDFLELKGKEIARLSVKYADALIKELNKGDNNVS